MINSWLRNILIIVILLNLLAGVLILNSSRFNPDPSGDTEFIARAQQKAAPGITVSASALGRQESRRSFGAIEAIIRSIKAGNMAGANRALAVLDGNDWRGVIAQVCQRIEPALISNVPPYEFPLKRAARQLLEAARKYQAEKQSAINSF
jgi:hypothetical protein